MIEGNDLLKTEILHLYYDPTTETNYLVERIAGVNNNYDIIKVTDQNLLLGDSYQPFSFSFIRQNRPPDANTVYFTNASGDRVTKETPMLYGGEITLNCPNYDTNGLYADLDKEMFRKI